MLRREQPGEGRAVGSAPALGQTPTPALDELFGSSSGKRLAPKFSTGCSRGDLGVGWGLVMRFGGAELNEQGCSLESVLVCSDKGWWLLLAALCVVQLQDSLLGCLVLPTHPFR